jgi:hypothetical protein
MNEAARKLRPLSIGKRSLLAILIRRRPRRSPWSRSKVPVRDLWLGLVEALA